MKQRITVKQLAELTEGQRRKLREWWQPKQYDVFFHCVEDVLKKEYGFTSIVEGKMDEQTKLGAYPLLSIGQCLKLLMDIGIVQTTICIRDKAEGIYQKADVSCWDKDYHNKDAYRGKGEELIDVLWQLIWR